MDVRKTIEDLHREMEKLDRAIASLEELEGGVTEAPLNTKCRRRKSLETKILGEPRPGSRGDELAPQPAVVTV